MQCRTLLYIITIMFGRGCGITPQQRYRIPANIPATDATHFMKQDHVAGSYHFGYDTGLIHQHSFREEVRLANGDVKGHFGYVDSNGALRLTQYTAGRHGYRATHVIHYLIYDDYPRRIIGPVPYFKKSYARQVSKFNNA